MKKSLVLAMALAMGVTASAYAANPFSDVPAGHWAYDSIQQLADAGVIEGYGDTTFGGDRLMTRYEMAQIVAKAMARGANVDKLAAEFADELDTLGVRVANLEKKSDNVKITGELRYRYWDYDKNGGKKDTDKQILRSRIWIKGQVNENWTYTGMLQNEQRIDNDDGDEDTDFQRAYINGRLGGVKVQAGRYHFKDVNDIVYGDRMDGIQVSYGKEVKLTVGAGKGADKKTGSSSAGQDNAEDMYYAELSAKIGVVDVNVDYYNFEDQYTLDYEDNELWAIGVGVKIIDDLKFYGTYLMSDYDDDGCDDDGFMVGLKYGGAKASKPNSWGIWANYYDMAIGTTVAPTFSSEAPIGDFKVADEGFEGYGVGAEYTVAKNMIAAVKWYDLEGKEGDKERDTLYAEMIITF